MSQMERVLWRQAMDFVDFIYEYGAVIRRLILVHRKARSGLSIRVNWTFLLGDTAEALQAKTDSKSALCKGVGQIRQIFT